VTARLLGPLGLLGLLALVASSATARANPLDAFGFGARAPALANAASAIAEDASANYYNPAGLVRGTDLRIDLAYRAAVPHLALNGRDLGVDDSRGLAVGLAAPGRLGPVRFAFGVSLWLPDQRLTRVRSISFDQPRFVYYDNRQQRLVLSANLALQIVRGLYVGAGLSFMSRTTGTVYLKGNIAVGNPDESALVTSIDVDLVAVRYPQAGILWEIRRGLSVAVVYRHSFLLRSDQAFRIDGNVGSEGEPPIIENGYFAAKTSTNDLFQPWQLTAGVAAQLLRPLLMTFDLTFARWSEFPVPASSLDLSLDVKQFNDLVKLPGPRQYPPSRFHDIVTPRLGVEVRALERGRGHGRVGLDVRGGYAYEPSPVPEQIGPASLADSDKHTFSLGLGLDLLGLGPVLPKPLSLDAFVATTWLPDRVHRKLDPLDRVGDFVSGGVIVNAGLGLRTRF
jgi:long-chain fatty acid transport protein